MLDIIQQLVEIADVELEALFKVLKLRPHSKNLSVRAWLFDEGCRCEWGLA